MIRIVICFLSALFIISCNDVQNKETNNLLKEYIDKKPAYLIKTGNFTSREKAVSAAVFLRKIVGCNIYIQKKSQNKDSLSNYVIELGKFKSSFAAGKQAYTLLNRGFIKDYQIIRNKVNVFDNFADILFVGKKGNITGVYKANIFAGNPERIWSKSNEIVADLDYSQDLSKAYFITVSSTGYNGIFPYVKKAKLYLIDILQNKVQLVKDFGDGIQIFSHWESQDFYKVILLSFDKANPIRIVELKLILNGSGVPLSEENKIIDLGKENYPQIPGPEINKVSPNKKYQLASTQLNKNTQIFLVDNIKKEKKLILNSNMEITESGWTEDNENLVFSTSGVFNHLSYSNKKGFSELNIYEVNKNKLFTIGGRDGYKNFLIRADLIIFDDGFNKKSLIQVFDSKKKKFINKISIKDGCGINNVPALPGNK